MGVIKQQQWAERRDRDRALGIARCLRTVLASRGKFDGQNMTKYLGEYRLQVEAQMEDEGMAIQKFAMVFESRLRKIVELIIEETANKGS
ncbi:unnamed protein product [Calypogeia fissa]